MCSSSKKIQHSKMKFLRQQTTDEFPQSLSKCEYQSKMIAVRLALNLKMARLVAIRNAYILSYTILNAYR